MTKIIAVGDLHHGPNFDEIEEAIQEENPDLTIFVGDYFDQFDDHRDHAYVTAQWLAESLEKPNRVHLMGNHDLAYAHPEYYSGPGYTSEKAGAIRAVLTDSDWRKLALWHVQDGWLFTHAGLSASHEPEDVSTIEHYLQKETSIAWTALEERRPHWIWGIGRARGGDASSGGILWCDWTREFKPVTGLNQVFGHTPGDAFKHVTGHASENWCIDVSSRTGLTQILAIENMGLRTLMI